MRQRREILVAIMLNDDPHQQIDEQDLISDLHSHLEATRGDRFYAIEIIDEEWGEPVCE